VLFAYLMLVVVGYASGRIHGAAIRWARAPRPTLELPRASARRTRYERVLHSLDARDHATWPMPERIPGEPSC
jgi:hypothetical protein